MKYFYVYTDLDDQLTETLADTTFLIRHKLDWERTKFDIAYIADGQQLTDQYPFGLIITTGKSLLLPDIYNSVVYTTQHAQYYIHYIYDTPLQLENAWQSSYTSDESLKYMVDTIYRYILREAIKENEEWCGHFSSVVGRM